MEPASATTSTTKVLPPKEESRHIYRRDEVMTNVDFHLVKLSVFECQNGRPAKIASFLNKEDEILDMFLPDKDL